MTCVRKWHKFWGISRKCVVFPHSHKTELTFTSKIWTLPLPDRNLLGGNSKAVVAKMETSITLVQSLIPLIFLLLCLALYIVRHYVSPGTSWFIQFLVTVSFTFGFFGLALMPIDLSLTTSIDSR